jgi:ATP-dependent helicase YprA (DUF1998 family)
MAGSRVRIRGAAGIQVAGLPEASASSSHRLGRAGRRPASEIRSAMTRVYEEMNSFNINGAKAACTRLQASAQTDLLSGSKSSLSVGSDPNRGQINFVRRVFETATRHLSNAQSIIDAG